MTSRLLVAGVGIPLLLVLFLFCPVICVAIVVGFLVAIAAYELLYTTGCATNKSLIIVSALMAFAVPFWFYFGCNMAAAMVGILIYMIALFAIAFKSKDEISLGQLGACMMASVIVPVMFSSLLMLCDMLPHNIYTMLPFFASFGSDSFALFGGKLFGKHKLAPVLSPNKTVEGSVGGLFGGVFICCLYAFIAQLAAGVQPDYIALVIFGLAASAVSQFGDLAFSYIKRRSSIKDYGHLFLSHGGVLDRFDSVIFCAPFTIAFVQFLPLFRL